LVMRIRWNPVTSRHQTRSMDGAQVDDSIGDTLVSVYAVGFASRCAKEVAKR
jgi:hypothetical protein